MADAPFNQTATADSILKTLGIPANDQSRDALLNHNGSQVHDVELQNLNTKIQAANGDPTKIFQAFIDVGYNGQHNSGDNRLAADLHRVIDNNGGANSPLLVKLREASDSFDSPMKWFFGGRPKDAAGYMADHAFQIDGQLKASQVGMQGDAAKVAATFGGTAQQQQALSTVLANNLTGTQVQTLVSELGSYSRDGTANLSTPMFAEPGAMSMPTLETLSDPSKSMLAPGVLSGWIDGSRTLTTGQRNAIQEMLDQAHMGNIKTPEDLKAMVLQTQQQAPQIVGAQAGGPPSKPGGPSPGGNGHDGPQQHKGGPAPRHDGSGGSQYIHSASVNDLQGEMLKWAKDNGGHYSVDVGSRQHEQGNDTNGKPIQKPDGILGPKTVKQLKEFHVDLPLHATPEQITQALAQLKDNIKNGKVPAVSTQPAQPAHDTKPPEQKPEPPRPETQVAPPAAPIAPDARFAGGATSPNDLAVKPGTADTVTNNSTKTKVNPDGSVSTHARETITGPNGTESVGVDSRLNNGTGTISSQETVTNAAGVRQVTKNRASLKSGTTLREKGSETTVGANGREISHFFSRETTLSDGTRHLEFYQGDHVFGHGREVADEVVSPDGNATLTYPASNQRPNRGSLRTEGSTIGSSPAAGPSTTAIPSIDSGLSSYINKKNQGLGVKSVKVTPGM